MPDVSQTSSSAASRDLWPALPLADWRDTYATLHMWTQIVGKVRLALVPLINHWWNVPQYVTARGLGTGAMPLADGRDLQIDFDFVGHRLVVLASDGRRRDLPLAPRSVADFYREVMAALEALGAAVRIWPVPVEVPEPVPFTEDRRHASYDPEAVGRFWRILAESAQVFTEFRGRFVGKCSPVHFFWGSFDLAVTRFNGRRAPARPDADRITREAYSHECISHGFWPGGNWLGTEIPSPLFYSDPAPEPKGLREQPIRPAAAQFDPKLGEFVLRYDDVRTSPDPRQILLEFLQSTYEAGANCAGWERGELERE